MRNHIRKIADIMILALTLSMLCGFSPFDRNLPKLKPSENIIFERIVIGELTNALNSSFQTAKDKYDGHDVLFIGKISKIDKKTITVSDLTDSSKFVEVSAKNSFEGLGYNIGDSVKVFGTLNLGKSNNSARNVALYTLEKSNTTLQYDYEFYNGQKYKLSDSKTVSLADGKVKYHTVPEWESVQKTEALKGIEAGSGYYYMLNDLYGSAKTECLAVFYFDYKQHLLYETSEKKTSRIEREIVSNIIGEKGFIDKAFATGTLFSVKDRATYGKTFNFYTTTYDDHKIEFVFTPSKGGLCVMVYTYLDEPKSRQDILYMMRTLEVI